MKVSSANVGSIFIIYLLTIPLFLLIYRIKVFHTLPYDQYYQFVLALDNKLVNFESYSPTGYRFLFIWMAYLFYEVIPAIPFSNLADISVHTAKAIQACSLVSYGFWVGSGILCYVGLRRKGVISLHAILTSLLIFAFIGYMAFYGIDPLYCFFTIWILLSKSSYLSYAFLCITSFLVCEKIAFGLLIFFLLRQDSMTKEGLKNWVPPLVGSGMYFITRWLYPLSGNEHQVDPSSFFTNVLDSLNHFTSVKGIYLNLLPIILLALIWYKSYMHELEITNNIKLQPIIVLIFFLMLAIIVKGKFTIGRIALHSLPFFIPTFLSFASSLSNKRPSQSALQKVYHWS